MSAKNTPATTGGHTTAPDRGVYREGDASDYTPAERDELRALMGAGDAGDAELRMLQRVSARTGLDPFLREVYLIGRRTQTGGYRGDAERWETKWTVQAGLEGFRKALLRYADSRGEPANIETRFYDQNGNVHPVWIRAFGEHPAAAEAIVTVGDSTARAAVVWEEYCPMTRHGKPMALWASKPSYMLQKCAETAAIRRICPLTAGMYEPAEMMHAASPVRATATRGLAAAARRAAGHDDDASPAAIEPAALPDTTIVAELMDDITSAGSHAELEELVKVTKAAVSNGTMTAADGKSITQAARDRWNEIDGTPRDGTSGEEAER